MICPWKANKPKYMSVAWILQNVLGMKCMSKYNPLFKLRYRNLHTVKANEQTIVHHAKVCRHAKMSKSLSTLPVSFK